MVEKVRGYDKDDNIIFERSAREYDKSIASTVFGITLSDVFKVIPVLILLVTVYVNQQNFNAQILNSVNNNSRAIEGISTAMSNLNNYLSASTGKRFKNGEPL